MSIETTQLLMESVIVGVGVMEVAAVALAAFGFCLLAIAMVREARGPNEDALLKEEVIERPSGPNTASPHRLQASISACIAAMLLMALLPSTALALPGDMNCDGAINTADVPLFVQALLATGSFGGCDISRADMNADSLIDGRDAQPFVAALLQAHSCPVGLLLCGGVCVDPNFDLGNCGSCGHACDGGENCAYGFCQPAEPCWDCGAGR